MGFSRELTVEILTRVSASRICARRDICDDACLLDTVAVLVGIRAVHGGDGRGIAGFL
jgi:hypothetical protein